MRREKILNDVKKDMVSAKLDDNENISVSDEELALINTFTRRELKKDEVYVFSVVLCDNEVDRDNERFTVESLNKLSELFVGKTGIFDHNPTAKNQTARIFSCCVEKMSGKKTKLNDDYFILKARAYMPKSEKNKEIILSLDSGIVKEVSVGCAVSELKCSICGEDINRCSHEKGQYYQGKLCCGELVNPYDAYEFSFVAVPAQKNAGVTKSYKKNGKELNMEEILKKLSNGEDISLDKSDCKKLCSYIDSLKKSAGDGIYYRKSLTNEVLRLSAIVQPGISRDTMESIAKSMSVSQLNEFKNEFKKKKSSAFAVVPQLYNAKNENKTETNNQFTI